MPYDLDTQVVMFAQDFSQFLKCRAGAIFYMGAVKIEQSFTAEVDLKEVTI